MDRERLFAARPVRDMERRGAVVSAAEVNFCAMMSSSMDLKSSRKMVSDAHLKTRAKRQ